MIPTEMGKLQLAAALCDTEGFDVRDVCPHCGESNKLRPLQCTNCGVQLLDWFDEFGLWSVHYIEENGHE